MLFFISVVDVTVVFFVDDDVDVIVDDDVNCVAVVVITC